MKIEKTAFTSRPHLTSLTELFVLNFPLLVFLIVYRNSAYEKFLSYTLPFLGDFPKAILFDISLLIIVTALYYVLSRINPHMKKLMGVVMLALLLIIISFRTADYYYYYAVQRNLNAYVLYTNKGFTVEGLSVVMSSPFFMLLSLLVLVHYCFYSFSSSYSSRIKLLATRLSRRPIIISALFFSLLTILAINAYSIAANKYPYEAAKSYSGEYTFLDGLPRFLRTEIMSRSRNTASASEIEFPKSVFMPAAFEANLKNAATINRPNIFIITIESFNKSYLNISDYNAALKDEIFPHFKKLLNDGFYFDNYFTSSAYTINGFVSILCSQLTMSESVWGGECLPEVLQRNGYLLNMFVSITQLLPKHYATLERAGLSEDQIFDASRMRIGKKNVGSTFMVDSEVFDYAYRHVSQINKKTSRPLFTFIATNQMHIPGYSQYTQCNEYNFPHGLSKSGKTKSMINSAYCTDIDLHMFIEHLKSIDMYDNSLIIITADHATNIDFWDFSENELASIPLFIKFPATQKNTISMDVHKLSSHVDIAPTIIDYLGLSTKRLMYGHSLFENGITNEVREAIGISTSRLISINNEHGSQYYDYLNIDNIADIDATTRKKLDSVYETVLYFDHNPDAFTSLIAN